MKHKTPKPHTLFNLLATMTQRQFFYASLGVLCVSLVLLIASLAVQSASDKPVKPANGFAVGREVRSGKVTVQIVGVTTSQGTGKTKAPNGQQFYIVTLAVRNNTDQTIQVLPSLDTYIKNRSGEVSYLSPYSLDKPFRAGSLLAGETIQGQLSYIASDDIQQVKYYIDAAWSGGALPFQLKENK